jgi:hypothetical protein
MEQTSAYDIEALAEFITQLEDIAKTSYFRPINLVLHIHVHVDASTGSLPLSLPISKAKT